MVDIVYRKVDLDAREFYDLILLGVRELYPLIGIIPTKVLKKRTMRIDDQDLLEVSIALRTLIGC